MCPGSKAQTLTYPTILKGQNHCPESDLGLMSVCRSSRQTRGSGTIQILVVVQADSAEAMLFRNPAKSAANISWALRVVRATREHGHACMCVEPMQFVALRQYSGTVRVLKSKTLHSSEIG